MAWRARLAVLLVAAIASLAGLAYATPIDPSFPGGFYDNGDYDDVVDFICSAAGVVDALPVPTFDGIRVVVGTAVDTGGSRLPEPPRPTSESRAPPLAA